MLKMKSGSFYDKVLVTLFIALAVFLITLIVAQICLRNGSTREMFTGIEKYENISYKANSEAKIGSVEVKLLSGKPSDDIAIWFNGAKVDSLTEKSKKITIDCDGVIEIKNDSGKKIRAVVKNCSDEIEILMNNKLEFSRGIKVLCSVRIKD